MKNGADYCFPHAQDQPRYICTMKWIESSMPRTLSARPHSVCSFPPLCSMPSRRGMNAFCENQVFVTFWHAASSANFDNREQLDSPAAQLFIAVRRLDGRLQRSQSLSNAHLHTCSYPLNLSQTGCTQACSCNCNSECCKHPLHPALPLLRTSGDPSRTV